MGKFTSEFEYELHKELIYQCPNGEKKAKKLLLKAPSDNHKKMKKNLGRLLSNAVIGYGAKNNSQQNSKEQASSDESSLDFAAILSVLNTLSKDDFNEYCDLFWELLLDNLCFVYRDIPLTESLLKSVDADDELLIIGHYSANFILPLWIKLLMKK